MALLDLIRNYIPDFTSPLSIKNLNDNFSSIWNKLDGNVQGENISVQTITSTNLQDACIDTAKIADLAVSSAKIQLLAVTSAHIENASITTAKIADLAVDNGKIANLSVDSAKIIDASITNAKLDRASANKIQIQTADIVDANITTAKIADLSVTTSKIADASIDSAKIVDLSVTSAKIADGSISNAKIGTLAVGTAQIQLGAITTALIGTGAIDTAQIADGSITDAKIVSLTANKITAGTIDAGTINVTNLNTANLTVGKINGNQIDANTITSANLASSVNNSIATAQTTADGKNKIYYAGSAPTGGTYKVNDIWFNTADGNKISYWNGTAWTLSTLGNSAIANLDAGKITTGTLDANRIGANSITANKINVGINSNILANGIDTMEQYATVPNYSKAAVATVSFDTNNKYYGTKSIKLVGTGTYNYVFLGSSSKNYGCVPVTTGKIYRVSCYVYNPNTTSLTAFLSVRGHTAIDGTDAPSILYKQVGVVDTDGWKRLEFAFTATSQYPYVSLLIATLNANSTCYFDAFQIEEVSSTTQLAGPFKPYGTTFIDGSNITTNTITATQIAVNTITGDRLVADSITANEIAASAITANELASNSVTANKILAGSVDATKITVSTLSSITADLGTITAGIIQSANYATSGGVCTAGMRLTLADAVWDSKNFKISSVGNVTAIGATLQNVSITGDGTINWTNPNTSVGDKITINSSNTTENTTLNVRTNHFYAITTAKTNAYYNSGSYSPSGIQLRHKKPANGNVDTVDLYGGDNYDTGANAPFFRIIYNNVNTVYMDGSNGNTTLSGTLNAKKVVCGYDGGYDNSISCSNFFRSSGSSGWINTTYNGGWYMYDDGWMRCYGDKGIYTYNTVQGINFVAMSSETIKDGIVNVEKDPSIDTLQILKDTDIYTYHLNKDLDAENYFNKKIGMIVERASDELVNEDKNGIDLYSVVATLWNVVKQQQNAIEELQKQVEVLHNIAK